MKSIVIYYSYGGNTRRVAETVRQALDADVAEIKTVRPYEGSYNDVVVHVCTCHENISEPDGSVR